ncbi:YobH family protein [Apirhabdus apintestini]|uniref:YobH family protein n=1 Tax=Erwinia sp. HR93 TaxID=3094840 RepID=UPI002ADEE55F|nr:YobH family protein [Erwinia sp. HR93]MEA1065238.1 YobH family protein [Erwinia sp. HR93]WPM85693.1 YobH family protein [Enterobacteriaceae bacterium CA-0114]
MRIIIRTMIAFALVWGALLFSGYGFLVGSKENAAGLGLKCQYLAARGVMAAEYVHTESGIIGVTNCPILRKIETTIDNGR